MTEPTAIGNWAVIANPAKFDDLTMVQSRFAQLCADHDWPEPTWYETTPDDPGTGQARQAIAEGATLVCPLGGDGTVRAVATALVEQNVPLGLLPGGTGNLVARNLKLPVDDLDAALLVAVTGQDCRIDVGLVRFDDGPAEAFLVMTGMGLDGEIMAEVDEGLKRTVGWWAYLISGARALFRFGFEVSVQVGPQRLMRQHARTVLVANCGELTAGVRLVREASVTDGRLDALVASPNSLSGWVAVVLHVLSARRRGHPALVHLTAPQVEITAKRPVACQLDGDPAGEHHRLRCDIRPGALRVRLPS